MLPTAAIISSIPDLVSSSLANSLTIGSASHCLNNGSSRSAICIHDCMTDVLQRLKVALTGCYTIECELGAGGMATVYLAHDVKHDRKVAVKVLRPELAERRRRK